MALQAAYKQFLASPNTSALADDASLHYVTTTTSVAGATDIIKHLATVRNRIKKLKEEPLFTIENQHALVVEFDTNLEFVSSGGPYLPGLDDNFLADRKVFLAVTHVVSFNADGKITQIRQSWDQGSLLKQVEVIGRSGQNWPIRDAKDQIALIAKCAKGDAATAAAAAKQQALPTRSRGSSNAMRDPHATLDLFAPREELESVPATVVSPYAGRRPRQRSFTEILGDEPVEDPESPSTGRDRSQSPSKVIAPKVGAGKNFQPPRLFEADEEDEKASQADDRPRSRERFRRPDPRKYQHFELKDEPEPEPQEPERVVRPDPRKYQHFVLDDGSESQDTQEAPEPKKPAPKSNRQSKHESSWSFDDFTTPQKPKASRTTMHRARDIRHWGEDGELLENTPAPHPHVPKPRRDAEAHFEFVDDGPERKDAPTGRPRGALHNEGLHLYDNRLLAEDDGPADSAPAPLSKITNLNHRRKDFDPHFSMTDESPRASEPEPSKPVPEDRKKAVRMMESNWAPYDESPVSRKENDNPNRNGTKRAGDDRGIVIAGDGMGSRKGTSRGWFNGEDDEPQPVKKGIRGPPAKSDGFWDF
ncbi:hypothetical protein VTJ04DRAFT_916 [Mycothermus thermophilus]|uniref:uncharacterized protein n=1 Tax=Humicola insolens TaxID=85995 RepID=UPI0037432119